MLREILKYPNKFLEQKCEDETLFDEKFLNDLKTDMIETMLKARGVGLAANQIGVGKRIILIADEKEGCRLEDWDLYFMINPLIIESSVEISQLKEGCLSIPGIYENTKRSNKVLVKWQNIDQSYEKKEFSNLSAVCVLHEIDHLDGILFINRLSSLKKGLVLKKYNKANKK